VKTSKVAQPTSNHAKDENVLLSTELDKLTAFFSLLIKIDQKCKERKEKNEKIQK
jgi:hypothetical protein